MSPQRIQRQRRKGWRMPDGAVYVGRPTKWGNPLDERIWGRQRSLTIYRDITHGFWNPTHLEDVADSVYAVAYSAIDEWRKRIDGHPAGICRVELRGKDLACWCPLDQPCHADILLELANSGEAS